MAEIVRTGPTSAEFVQGSLRKYDAWGNSRLNSAPSGFHGYCGNLGHKEDPESGLTYMRARYYEPGTGRFISQDPARAGSNWYGYCSGNPSGKVDAQGTIDVPFHFIEQLKLELFSVSSMGVRCRQIISSTLIFLGDWLGTEGIRLLLIRSALFHPGEVHVGEYIQKRQFLADAWALYHNAKFSPAAVAGESSAAAVIQAKSLCYRMLLWFTVNSIDFNYGY